MPRVKRGFKARRRRNRYLDAAEGFYGGRSRMIRTVMEAVENAWKASYRGRKEKKRDFRALWQTRISAGATASGMNYSRLMGSLKEKQIALNRKMLSELAIHYPDDFKAIVEFARPK
ncbi:MAG: 50S ribosomal protein L20 [Deltaproteobacteria bacterium RIFCSPLOWO2_02_FULL_44_10]|nr:MAG: 50S ribosomal protein L20 [Deltaproteobacteria bacterium RIFCSPHIGHO2_02_FULL_44_16]OGQ47397.1 MAG: 50S ribosomal protein L20 [Deltaproteobacteria bacterium RIFCSPLOWO2_02_FULL_44_10]